MVVEFKPKQRQFLNCRDRYPAYVASWGTGKTMCAIIKGLLLSETYANNLGLIVRKNFTDLRDSTLKDFERYTGMTVKKDAKEVELPNGSVIMFRHGDELSGLQNINLGWFYIEQAEEFESAEQFDMLRGRLRRWECPLRQGLVIANTAGHNWIWRRWKKEKHEGYTLVEANIEDAKDYLPADVIADWQKLKDQSPKKYRRYVLNSWEDYDLEGAYYASLMSDLLVAGRIGRVPYDPAARVYTAWDLGVSDSTVIWFFQIIRQEIHLIDYYENTGEGIGHYAKVLQDKPYVYGEHYAPHDIQGRSLQTGKTTLEIAKSLGIDFDVVIRHQREDGIEAVRSLIPKCWFDEEKCAKGIEALEHYKRKKNDTLSTEDKSVFSENPLHDWASHPADAMRYLAVAYRYQLTVDDVRIGYPEPIPAAIGAEKQDYNPLGHFSGA